MSATTVLETLVVRLTAQPEQFDKVMLGVEQKLTAAANRLASFGTRMSLAVTAPLAVVKATSIAAFASFDDAMTKSLAIMGDVSAEQRKRMEAEAKRISTVSATAPAKVAEAYYFLASAGMDAEKAIKAVSVVEQFATAGAFDMARATEMLTDAHSSLGMRSQDAQENMLGLKRVSDVLADAANASNASVEQFAAALQTKAGAAARLLGKDVEEVTAVLAVFADQGTKSSLAGERTSIMMREMQRAATSNHKEWARQNIAAFDATGKFRHLADIVGDLERRLLPMSDRMRRLTLEQMGLNSEAQDAIMPLLGLSSEIRRYEDRLRKAGGTTQDVAEKQMQSFANQMAIMRNKVTIAAISIGERLAPVLLKINSVISIGLEWWEGLSDKFKSVVVYAGMIVAAIGPAALGLSTFLRIGAMIVATFTPIISTIFTGVVAFLTSWPALIMGVATAWMVWTESGQKFSAWLVETFGPAVGAVGEYFKAIWNFLKAGNFEAAGRTAMAGLKVAVYDGLDAMTTRFGSFARGVVETFLGATKLIGDAFIGMQTSIAKGILKMAQQEGIVGDLIAKVLGVDVRELKYVENIDQGLMDALKTGSDQALKDWDAKMTNATASTNAFLDNIGESAEQAREEYNALLNASEMEKQAVDSKNAINKLTSWLKGAVGKVNEWVDQKRVLDESVDKPVTVTFAVEGVEALEHGTARAERALLEYFSKKSFAEEPVKVKGPSENKPNVVGGIVQAASNATGLGNVVGQAGVNMLGSLASTSLTGQAVNYGWNAMSGMLGVQPKEPTGGPSGSPVDKQMEKQNQILAKVEENTRPKKEPKKGAVVKLLNLAGGEA